MLTVCYFGCICQYRVSEMLYKKKKKHAEIRIKCKRPFYCLLYILLQEFEGLLFSLALSVIANAPLYKITKICTNVI